MYDFCRIGALKEFRAFAKAVAIFDVRDVNVLVAYGSYYFDAQNYGPLTIRY